MGWYYEVCGYEWDWICVYPENGCSFAFENLFVLSWNLKDV
jgi:hypothetical protein